MRFIALWINESVFLRVVSFDENEFPINVADIIKTKDNKSLITKDIPCRHNTCDFTGR